MRCNLHPNEYYRTQIIKDKCKLNEFTKEEITILEDVIDNLYYKDTLKVGSVIVNHYKILDKLKLIVKENLIQLLDGSRSSLKLIFNCIKKNRTNLNIM